MRDLHKEHHLESEICAELAASGWIYEAGANDAGYDKALALFPADLLAWVRVQEPDAWAQLERAQGAKAADVLALRVREALNRRGVVTVLREGIEIIGLKRTLPLCQFRPALGMNEVLQARYAANRLRVLRQVRYAQSGGNAIDLVLFLNGIPVATAELKSDFTQSVQDAIEQYQVDRVPKGEPLLSVPGGAVVHFAVSNSEVRMCTRLDGLKSMFLPFNRGNKGGAGNEPNPNGAATAYLWEEIWQPDSWLDILGRYIIARRDAKKQITGWIFPRFHQLSATRKLVRAILDEGVGHRYLIQHSAGSGKTNSIAWTAHFLSDLHDAEHHKVFDSVLVVSDRTVLDRQLAETIESFERIKGVVASISGNSGSKSEELASALKGGKKIVICTIQTFPFALAAIRALAADEKKHFAVIADEAHSSQTGTAASKLKLALSAEEVAALADGGEIGTEDVLAAEMAAKAAGDSNISYIAFTATPKSKTLELFGRLPKPHEPSGPDNLPIPFDLYTMRQAIDEEFILDVLKNYLSYKQAFRLSQDGRELDEREVDASAAKKALMQWVRLHPENIAARVQITIEHFRENVQPLLSGRARAMVVTASRREAVRWKLAMEAYVKARGYSIGLLAAFSGEVDDPEVGTEPFTEVNINPDLKGRDLREVFAEDPYRLLIVANKFQTGFDQPLLCGMYVDRRLGGLQAVQTLSRLNRSYPGKDITYVVDFVNESADILAAFQEYYETASLLDVSNPQLVVDLRYKLDDADLYDLSEVERVVQAALASGGTQGRLDAAIEPVRSRIVTRHREARAEWLAEPEGSRAREVAKGAMDSLEQFRGDLGAYVRLYEFFSQMLDYGNTAFEKLYVFAKLLTPLLKFERERETVDLAALQLTHHRMKDLGKQKLALKADGAGGLEPISDAGSGKPQDKQKTQLAAIIAAMNDLFEGDFTHGESGAFAVGTTSQMVKDGRLVDQAAANTKDQFANSPDLKDAMHDAVISSMDVHGAIGQRLLADRTLLEAFALAMVQKGGLYEALRAAKGQTATS
ncbi:type I restriction endonuclease subunit R [Tanticharoenia sakaeratensis]|uniref:Type-1 restriction enzyme MjaXP R protein n=1 Tax=Tanticharoenia sakaeratensis NBRC 103193 TaxID=1231623 RepID=A0A0D6MNH8_9PROT|nr:type I restriction endonuclease [Tanticharoenia sakaeratensis]GAN54833.1 type-1 restriction enzyme MjaXP R protein [Tanticharoenia sakaeratensis NBRC 103193]GBQ21419.1 type I site-specific restriction-modification system R subunit [Tanticharoenia sakaeratensis NBRC 103193]